MLSIHKDAAADLGRLKRDVPGVHARLAALLRQMKADERLLEKLLTHGYGKDGDKEVGVSKWHRYSERGLWRLKCWELEQYGWKIRLIYVYLPQQVRVVLMGVFRREEFDYDDPDNPLHRRVLASVERSYGA